MNEVILSGGPKSLADQYKNFFNYLKRKVKVGIILYFFQNVGKNSESEAGNVVFTPLLHEVNGKRKPVGYLRTVVPEDVPFIDTVEPLERRCEIDPSLFGIGGKSLVLKHTKEKGREDPHKNIPFP